MMIIQVRKTAVTLSRKKWAAGLSIEKNLDRNGVALYIWIMLPSAEEESAHGVARQ
jgi:hypothetical protein